LSQLIREARMPIRDVYAGNVLDLESEPAGDLVIHGTNCRLRVGRNVDLQMRIEIHRGVSNAIIDIADGCILRGVIRLVRGDGARIRIGERTTFNAVGISMHEAGEISVGRDCMLSTDIHMDVSDMHPIFDRRTGVRINPPQDIRLEDHVWLSTRVLVLKGARIGSGAIIGAGAMVAGAIPPHVLAIGSPARVVREHVTWERDFDATPVVVADEPAAPADRAWSHPVSRLFARPARRRS
jgi:acetyltransferase-like isoleucine patch superfamily enzyme